MTVAAAIRVVQCPQCKTDVSRRDEIIVSDLDCAMSTTDTPILSPPAAWNKAYSTLTAMMSTRGLNKTSAAPVLDKESGKFFWKAWGKPSVGTSCYARGVNECTVLMMSTRACVGKQNAIQHVNLLEKTLGGSWPLPYGSVIFVHSSHLSTDATNIFKKNNVQVYSVFDLQFDVLAVNQREGLLHDMKLCDVEISDAATCDRKWLSTDAMSKYLALRPGDRLQWKSVDLCCPGHLVEWKCVVV